MIKLFVELYKSDIFHFGDKPERKLIKADSSHYVSPNGNIRRIHPYVAVFPEEPKDKNSKPLFRSNPQ